MKNTDAPFFIGYVEQAVAGGQEPLNPPISISKNGTLAKWRDKLHFINLRVNDPGLKLDKDSFIQTLKKASSLGIEVIVSLPEYVPSFYELPPNTVDGEETEDSVSRGSWKKGDKVAYFKPVLLSHPSSVSSTDSYHLLTIEECRPIIETAAEHGVRNIIVPVSGPGLFLDPKSEEDFKVIFREIYNMSKSRGIQLHLRNGGLSHTMFERLRKEFDCKLAISLGFAHLEQENALDLYRKYREDVSIILFQQILPGLDKWTSRQKEIERSFSNFLTRSENFEKSLDDTDEEYAETCLRRFNGSLKGYYEACLNPNFNLGLFQNGDLNFVPFLREIRRELDKGFEKYILLETIPNTRNTEFVLRYLLPDGFPGAL